MEDSLVSQILLYFRFQWLDIRKHIPVRNHHSAGFSGRAGRKDNFQGIFASERRRSVEQGRMSRDRFAKRFDRQRRNPDARRCNGLGINEQLGLDLLRHPRCKLSRRNLIDRNDDGAAQYASPERDEPFGTVLHPQQHCVARTHAARFELSREAASLVCDSAIAPALNTVTSEERNRDLILLTGIFGEEFDESFAPHSPSKCA